MVLGKSGLRPPKATAAKGAAPSGPLRGSLARPASSTKIARQSRRGASVPAGVRSQSGIRGTSVSGRAASFLKDAPKVVQTSTVSDSKLQRSGTIAARRKPAGALQNQLSTIEADLKSVTDEHAQKVAEADKLRLELEALKARPVEPDAATLARLEAVTAELNEARATIRKLEESLVSVKVQHEEALRKLRIEGEDALRRAQQKAEDDVRSARLAADEEAAKLRAAHLASEDRLRQAHEAALVQHRDEHTASLAAIQTQLSTAIEAIGGKERELAVLGTSASERQVALEGQVALLRDEGSNLSHRLSEAMAELERLRGLRAADEVIRRRLHNECMDLRGRIRVYCRIRPNLGDEEKHDAFHFPEGEDGSLVTVSTERSSVRGETKKSSKSYSFDRVFTTNSTQETLFQDVSQLVTSALDGYNVTIFAYGQTGSGKTHTMIGDVSALTEHSGIVPRSAAQIFEHIALRGSEGWKVSAEASVLEIYNGGVYDLLGNPSSALRIVEKAGVPSAAGLRAVPVSSAENVIQVMERAFEHRRTAATQCNERSSRSHTMFRLSLRSEVPTKDGKTEIRTSVMNLVDLAGSERLNRAHSQVKESELTASQRKERAERVEETKAINSSLSALSTVMVQLVNEESHVAYRNSELTRLLQPSLDGTGKCCLIVCGGGGLGGLNETVNTLNFGSNVRVVKRAKGNARAVRNVSVK